VSFAAITLRVASQRVLIIIIIVYFVMTQSGNFWIYSRIFISKKYKKYYIKKRTKYINKHMVQMKTVTR
jgi:hypothetical protein